MSTSTTPPLVSIVVPIFNGQRYLTEALDSCLAQTYRNIEVVCVDDCSSDNSVEIAESVALKDSRLRVIRRDVNGGIARAFNAGFEAASGRYLTRLACDDAFYSHAIELMVGALETEKGFDLAYCDMDQIDEDSRVLYQLITNPPTSALLPRNRLGLCVMWTRTLMDAVGWFDPRTELAEDYDFWLRASLDFKFYKVEASPQIKFRIHKSQMSIARAKECDAVVIRVHILYLWRLVLRSRFSFRRWVRLLRSMVRVGLFTCKNGWVSTGR